MNRQELLEEIRRLHVEKGIPANAIAEETFLDIPEYNYLKPEYENRSNRVHDKEKWHQIVRFALDPPEKRRYMYDKLLRLVLKYRKSPNSYFRLKTEKGTILFPDLTADLNRFFVLYREYFQICREIISKIHFEYPVQNFTESRIVGKVNWQKTMTRSNMMFPVQFDVTRRLREFDVPENVLLVVVAKWIEQDSSRLLASEYNEPLALEESRTLNSILANIEQMIDNFPFPDIVSEATRFAQLPRNDHRVAELEQRARARFSEGLVHNHAYSKLLKWIEEYRELNIRMVSTTQTRFQLESVKDLDTVYEAWIFYEIIDHLSEIEGLQLELHLEEKVQYFEFIYGSRKVWFFYEKPFQRQRGYGWVLDHRPDYCVMTEKDGGRIVAVFDAKNYAPISSERSEATNKMLSYMINLDTGFGALIFPEFHFEEFVHNQGLHHHDLKLVWYRMEPQDTETALAIKKDMISRMLREIIMRL